MLKLQYTDGSQKGVWLIEPKQKLGRDRKNDLVLTAEDVGDFHAEVHVQGETLRLEPLAGHGCQVNGAPIAGVTPIRLGDRIRIGSVELQVMDPRQQKAAPKASAAAATGGGGWVLVSQAASGATGKRWPIQGTMVVGRATDCAISIAYDRMSRKHAEFKVSGGVLTLRDLGSANGTFLNDKPVTDEARVKAGDRVRFDMLAFTVQGPEDDSNKTVVRPAIDLAALQQAQAPSRPAARAAGRPAPRTPVVSRADAPRQAGAPASASSAATDDAGSPLLLIVGAGVVLAVAAAALWFFLG